MIIPAKFQPSSFTGTVGKRGDTVCHVTSANFPMIRIQKKQNEP